MNDPNFGYGNATTAPQPSPMSPGQYKFSPDELRVLSDCNRESFFQRSLPLSTLLGFGSFVATQKGYLRPNPRFGAIPKVTLAVMMGYFLGKLSYQQACAEKLMALPGSYIGQLLRDRRDGKVAGPALAPNQTSPATMFGATKDDIYSDAGPGNSLNLDTDRPLFNNDDYRSGDAPLTNPGDAAPDRPPLSYDDLRRQNRGEYSKTKQDPYRIDPSNAPIVVRPRPQPSPSTPTNQYGDALE